MSKRRAAFLSSRTHCPQCGRARVLPMEGDAAHFECGMVVELNAGSFAVVVPCRRPSEISIRHWNQQTEKE
ncbi:hypothetical protein [Rhizobium oryzicola]|uniref:Uncharacterized protein n=1 Tax=Rhizobium oryzicola TaxID=1232668 RepID=A0ABT8SVU0_9HYPH|nr:hypothetical protein [Rhizobium oryzicola]MDO1582410.1 hypothetical protein [Rhizobium oryzicola]